MKLTFTVLCNVIGIVSSLSSCFSTYPIQKKFPCEETTTQEKLDLIKDAYNSILKPEELDVTDKGVRVKIHRVKSYEFDNILYVRVRKKLGKHYIQIRDLNGEMNEIYLRDPVLIEETNNALMCLTNLHDTNGRPGKGGNKIAPEPNKYENLEKIKKLLDSGAITQEEYEKEKQKLLND